MIIVWYVIGLVFITSFNIIISRFWIDFSALPPKIWYENLDDLKEIKLTDLKPNSDFQTIDKFVEKYVIKSIEYFPLREKIYSQYNYIQSRQFFSVLIHIPLAYVYAFIFLIPLDINPTIKIIVFFLLLSVCFIINYLIFRVIKERYNNLISTFYDDSDIIIENYRKKSDEERKEIVGFELEEDVAINCLLMSEHYNYLKSIEYEVQKKYILVRQFVAVYVASSAFILFLTGII